MEAILLDQSILDNDSPLTTITIVKIVVNKLAGTKKEQIATQFCRENWKRGSKSNINSEYWSIWLIIAVISPIKYFNSTAPLDHRGLNYQ